MELNKVSRLLATSIIAKTRKIIITHWGEIFIIVSNKAIEALDAVSIPTARIPINPNIKTTGITIILDIPNDFIKDFLSETL